MSDEDKDKGFKNVYRLGFVSFFTDISSEMVFSILPVYILGLPGGSPAMLGLIEGIAESLSYILRAVTGVLSDKFRRRKAFILIGYGLSRARDGYGKHRDWAYPRFTVVPWRPSPSLGWSGLTEKLESCLPNEK